MTNEEKDEHFNKWLKTGSLVAMVFSAISTMALLISVNAGLAVYFAGTVAATFCHWKARDTDERSRT